MLILIEQHTSFYTRITNSIFSTNALRELKYRPEEQYKKKRR